SLTFQTGSDAGDTTTLTGLSNMSATDANGGVGDSLSIAMKSGAGVSATEATDGDSILASVTGSGTAANSNLSLLASGTYTVRITYGGTAGSSSDIELLDSAGNAMYIAATPADGTGNVTKKLTAQDLDTGPVTVNFGNGLAIGVAAKANGTYNATVNFTAGGTYSIYTQGDTGTEITDGTLTAANFSAYMSHIQGKINSVSTQLSAIGALNGRLSFKEDQVSTSQINVESAYNRIMNANMAEEQVNASKYQILQQTAAAMLAQANSAPQFVLNLFR
ncbi:MAG TPA: flagellin, partial [Anaerolineaceae bacterium]|nr:flagellin [Anaerolineaceae bacterium]